MPWARGESGYFAFQSSCRARARTKASLRWNVFTIIPFFSRVSESRS